MNKKLLDPLIHLLEIKSVSTLDEYLPEMEKARHFLIDLFADIGLGTKKLKGKKHDAIFAQKIINKNLPTVLVYGHYDVQPPDPFDQWKTPPFKPTIKEGKIFGRGTTDNKCQFMIHVMAVKKLMEEGGGKLPINIKFIIEGEEEIGSISVEGLAKKYSKNLLSCDYLVVSDSEMLNKDKPAIDVSLRGLVYTEVTIETAKHDLHSGLFGGIAQNPANLMAHLISKLKNEKGEVLIPGFYKDVLAPTKEELEDYKSSFVSENEIKKEGEFYNVAGESNYSLNERRWSRPTLDVNGITSGYQGSGSKTIIPAKASAKISMRLVPNQTPSKIFTLFESYVKKVLPKDVKVKVEDLSSCLAYKAPTTHPIFTIAKKVLKENFGKEPVYQGSGGSIGFIPVLTNALKVPCLMIGFGLPDDNLHAPNEHFSLLNYEKGIDTMVSFFKKVSGV